MSGIYAYVRRYLFVCAVLLALCGCDAGLREEGKASLKLVLNTPAYEPVLKSVSSAPDASGEWTQWERAVDGRYIYRATAFVLQGNRLVAHKDIQLDEEVQEVTLDFDENFTHGSYTLVVVANYSPHEAEDGSNGVRRYSGLEDFTAVYSDSFLDYKISSTGGVCALKPQPLALLKTIDLHPGVNEIAGELKRTYSRIRITIDNNSDEQLKVSSLSFCNTFTQGSAFLLPGKGYLNDRSGIDVTSPDALTPFAGTATSPVVISAQGMQVVFDAYILESQRTSADEVYSYSLGLSYGDKPVTAPSVVNIPLRTIDNRTGQAVDVNEISRNDFINAVVKVSYSKNQGHFVYEVKGWESAGGDVSFN